MLDGVHCGTLFQLKFDTFDTSSTVYDGPPCLAEARSRNGSGVINAIHYRSDASLPAGEGNIKALPLIVYLLFG